MEKQEIIFHLLGKYKDGDEKAGERLDEMHDAEMFEQHINEEYEGGWNTFSRKYKYVERGHRALYDRNHKIITKKSNNHKKGKLAPSNPFINY
jgi:hypothetical protein